MPQMNYTVWIDADGNRIALENMSNSHIKNCIKELERLLPTIRGYTPSKNDNDTHVFSFAWLYCHGHRYLQSLHHEIHIRNRIVEKDYPVIRLTPSCDTCDNLTCERDIPCDKWTPRNIVVLQATDNEDDAEILHRTGSYYLVIKPKVSLEDKIHDAESRTSSQSGSSETDSVRIQEKDYPTYQTLDRD